MITMKTINASDLAQRDAFFESLDKRTGETNQRVYRNGKRDHPHRKNRRR